jgi:antitoxin ParD1/3/4
MTTMNISLPDDMRAFVEDQAERGGYASASEYFRDLVRQAQKRKAKLELEAKLAEGLDSPAVTMTRKEWLAIEREALKGLGLETKPK